MFVLKERWTLILCLTVDVLKLQSSIDVIAILSTRKAKVVRSLRQCAPLQPKNFFMYEFYHFYVCLTRGILRSRCIPTKQSIRKIPRLSIKTCLVRLQATVVRIRVSCARLLAFRELITTIRSIRCMCKLHIKSGSSQPCVFFASSPRPIF